MSEGKQINRFGFIPNGKLEKAKFFLSVILSAVLITAAVWFIVSCISIYRNDEYPHFSRESVAGHLKNVAPISLISIALAIACGVVSLFAKEPKIRSIPIRKKTLLKIFKDKLSDFSTSDEHNTLERRERKRRKSIILISLSVSIVFVTVALIFVLDPSRYTLDDVNTDIAYSAVIAMISVILTFAVCYAASVFLDKSYVAELQKTKEEIKRLRLTSISDEEYEIRSLRKNEGHTVALVRVTVIAVAIAFIIAGIFNGGMADVLGKAVRICTECIGLG